MRTILFRTLNLVALSAALLAPISPALAVVGGPSGADPNPPPNLRLPENPLPGGANDALKIISVIANWIFSLLLILAVIFILVAAFNYLTSGGNSEKLTKAHRILIYALVAVAVALLAKGLITVVSSIVSSTPITLPD